MLLVEKSRFFIGQWVKRKKEKRVRRGKEKRKGEFKIN